MVSVLQMPCLHTFGTEDAKLKRQNCRTLYFGDIYDAECGLTICCKCKIACNVDESNPQSIDVQCEHSNGLKETEIVNCQQACICCQGCLNVTLNNSDSTLSEPSKYHQKSRKTIEGVCKTCNKMHTCISKKGHDGLKEKIELTKSKSDPVPSKRLSRYLNNQKEKKVDRKKVLKMSIKKLEDLDDPEAFLRRTVLVNNTRKRLQADIQREHIRTKHMKSFKRNGELTNVSSEDGFACEDLFSEGGNEKITDNMTETLNDNVFEKESAERKGILADRENSQNVLKEAKLSETKLSVIVKIEEVSYNLEAQEKIATGIVESNINKGIEALDKYDEMTFFWKLSCAYPVLEVGKRYLIIGRDGYKFFQDGEEVFRYLLMGTALVIEYAPQKQRHNMKYKILNTVHTSFKRVMLGKGCQN